MKLLYILFIVLFLQGCDNSSSQEKKIPGILKVFRSMDSALVSGDTITYRSKRSQIEQEIRMSGKIEYELYLKTFDAQQVLSSGNFDSATRAFENIVSLAEKNNVYYSMFVANNMLGNIAFHREDDLKAIDYWEKGLDLATKNNLVSGIPDLLTNIGSAYMRLGYFNSSAFHLMKAREIMDSLNIVSENYWINQINTAIAFLELRRHETAHELLQQTDKFFSDQITYLYYLNMASWASAVRNHEKMLTYIDSADLYLTSNKQYFLTNLEFKLSKLIELKESERMIKSINEYLKSTDEKSITLKCYFNRAWLLTNGTFYHTEPALISWEDSIDRQDFVTAEIHALLLADFYRWKGDRNRETEYLRKSMEYSRKLLDQKLNHQLEDNYWRLKNEQILNENKLLILKNITQQSSHKIERIIYIAIIAAIVMALIIAILIIKNFRNDRYLKTVMLELTETKLSLSKARSEELEKNLEEHKKRMLEVHKLIHRTTDFKRQLDDFFKRIKSLVVSGDLEEITKSTDLNFKAFFSLHQHQLDKHLENTIFKRSLEAIKTDYPHLTNREYEVIELIIYDYSSSEIAGVLGKSIKSVEVIRSGIRKKLQIEKEFAIRQWLLEKYIDPPGDRDKM